MKSRDSKDGASGLADDVVGDTRNGSNDHREKGRGAPGAASGRQGRYAWAAGLLLVVMTAVAYIPATRCAFIWDDDSYVVDNRALRTPEGLQQIWFQIGATAQYYPLVYTTYWIEYRLWELDPTGYHVVNVVLHALGALLLWRVLTVLRVPGAWLAAAVFALHPVHVQSVAWITQRKNVLSGVFYLGAALAYFPPLRVNRCPDHRLSGSCGTTSPVSRKNVSIRSFIRATTSAWAGSSARLVSSIGSARRS